MNRRPPELPNIEDATLRACLAPLMEAMNSANETVAPDPVAVEHAMSPADAPANSNDNPPPAARDHEQPGTPKTLAEWRTLADEEHGAFRTMELFLGMTDAELDNVAAEFPRQIGGTIARISRIKRRLAMQYDIVTTVTVLLERAMTRAAAKTQTAGD